jgi:hypothetical protein
MRTAAAVVFAFVLAAPAVAGLIRLDTTPFSAGSGGEFKATPLSGFVGLTGLPSDLSSDTFQTFCLERSENFSPGSNLTAVINDRAVQGGTGTSDPLDPRTAFLYTRFREGTLAGYLYGAGRQGAAGQLQNAIWFLENELPSVDAGSLAEALVNLANAAVAPGGEWEGMGLGDVRVLNLNRSSGERAQDQLTLIPTPGAAALVGLGVLCAARRRRG